MGMEVFDISLILNLAEKVEIEGSKDRIGIIVSGCKCDGCGFDSHSGGLF